MISRFGSCEAAATAEGIGISLGIRHHFRKKTFRGITCNAGVFPADEQTILEFCQLSRESAAKIDLLGVWPTFMQDCLVNEVCAQQMKLTDLGNLEPFFSPTPWTASLRGKKVLVIHPFKETIEKQYQMRTLLFENPNLLPEFELHVLKAVQTIAYEKDPRFSNWFEALEFMYREATKIDFDVAILGCGAYGMPLAAKLKESGKIAIHLGGATQLLFGIKGSRWDNFPEIRALYNEHWVRPSAEEKPKGAKQIEGACYW